MNILPDWLESLPSFISSLLEIVGRKVNQMVSHFRNSFWFIKEHACVIDCGEWEESLQ